jgi:hypothetical protein
LTLIALSVRTSFSSIFHNIVRLMPSPHTDQLARL